MTIGSIIFWICAVALLAVFVIWGYYMFFRSPKKESVRVVFAGSTHIGCQTSKEIDSDIIARLQNRISSKLKHNINITPYLVDGESMQFANIRSGDFVFAENTQLANTDLPKIVVLSSSQTGTNSEYYKLRRAWSLIPANASREAVRDTVSAILNSECFIKIKERIDGSRPSDDEMKDTVLVKFDRLNASDRSSTLLLSTTYRTDMDRIEFSLHPISRLEGIVIALCSPRSK